MEILAKVNWVDILALIIILRTSYVSLQDGLSHEILPLIGSIAMLVLSLHYYPKLAVFFEKNGISLSIEVLNLISFVLLAVAIGIIFRFLKAIIDKIIKVTWHPFLEKFGGLAAGIIRSFMLTSLILTMIVLIPLPYLNWSVRERSLTGRSFLRIGTVMHEKVGFMLPSIIR